MLLQGLRLKNHLLESLRAKVVQHRRDDLSQLSAARDDTWLRWEEQFSRLDEWKASTGRLTPEVTRLVSWRDTLNGFERAQVMSRRHGVRVRRKLERLEKTTADLLDRMQLWSDRVVLKEMELREFMERRVDHSPEILVPTKFKKSFLQFLFEEREVEGRFASEMKSLSSPPSRTLARLGRAKEKLSIMADRHPAILETRKNQIIDTWRPLQQSFEKLEQQYMNLASLFEQTRLRLRDIYEHVQHMRIVELPQTRRPLLHRLFNLHDD